MNQPDPRPRQKDSLADASPPDEETAILASLQRGAGPLFQAGTAILSRHKKIKFVRLNRILTFSAMNTVQRDQIGAAEKTTGARAVAGGAESCARSRRRVKEFSICERGREYPLTECTA
jgi:hypothetical protein